MGAVLAPVLFPSLVAGSTAFTVAVAGVNLALYAGVSAASLLLQQSMMPNQKQEIGTKLVSVLGGAVNQSISSGAKETAGSFIYKNSWGRAGMVPNAFLVRVYCLSDRRINAFENYVWAGNRKCSYDPGETQTIDGVNVGHPIAAFKSSGQNRLWVKFYEGGQTSADGYLTSKFGSDPQRPWTSDHVGRGRAYMIVTQKYDKKVQVGEIDVVPVIKNSKYYDWRGGGQTYGNYSSYGVDNGNAIVSVYNWMRGVYEGSEWMFGGQKWPAMRFDADSWTAAANKCDTNVSLAGGGTQKWAQLGAEIDCTEEPWSVIERGLKACGGRIVESGGVFKVYVGGIGASVYSFTDDDILVSEEFTARLFPARDQISNTITGTYVEPANAGEAKAFKARWKQEYLDEDGDVRKSTMDFEYVRDNRQAQRFATLALKDNRRFRSFVVAFWTQARKLEPCDVVSWTSDRFAFSNKKFIVGDVTLREDGVVIANLREADATDADWSTADEDAFETGVYEDVDAASQSLTATATAVAITDDDNTTARAPAIRIQATLGDDFVDCKALLWQVRKRLGDKKIIASGRSEGFFEPGNPEYGDIVFTSAAFKPGKQVQVRWKIEPESDRETAWSDDWSTTASYLELSASARLLVENVETGAVNDIAAIDTANVRPKAIEDRMGWTSAKKERNFTNEDKSRLANQSLGGASPIKNPNPSTVRLQVSGTIKAAVTNFTGQRGSAATLTTKISVYSAPVDNNGDVVTSKTVRVSSLSVIGKLEVTMAGKTKGKAGTRSFNVAVNDIYEGADGAAPRRKYWAEVDYLLALGPFVRAANGYGLVQNFQVKASWSKR